MMEKNEKKYTQEMLFEAMSMVKSKELSLNKASKLFGIPYATLGDKIRGRRPIEATRKFLLTSGEEEELVHWIIALGRRGFGINREEIKDAVKQILDRRNAITKCVDNRPGRAWLDYFFQRHPELSSCTPHALGKERAMITRESLSAWFNEMVEYVSKKDPSLLKSPERIYSADETEFILSTISKRVVTEKGAKHVYAITGNTKQQVTVLACTSAAGHYVAPLIIYPYKRIPTENILNGFEEAHFQISPNGCLTGPIFFTWLRDIFIPAVSEKKKPIVLFVDGHSSHSSLIEVNELCNEYGIILYRLKSHASHLIQPLDQAFFGAIKPAWEKASQEYLFQCGENVSLRTFAKVLSQAWKETAKPDMAMKGFKASGIFPFEPERVLSSDKLTPSLTFMNASPTSIHTPTRSTNNTQHTHPNLPSNPQSTSTSTPIPSNPPHQSLNTNMSQTSVPPLNKSQKKSFNDVKSLIKFVFQIGQDKTESFVKMYEQNVDIENLNHDFKSFKKMVNDILQVQLSSSPSISIPDSPTTIPQTSCDISDILPMPSCPKGKTLQEKQKTKAPRAPSGAAYKEWLKKKEEEKKAAAKRKELNKQKREKNKKNKAEKKPPKRSREELQEERRKEKEEETAKRRRRNEAALKRLEKEMQKKNVAESESDSNSEVAMEMDGSSEVDE